jgi:hypothetical protein
MAHMNQSAVGVTHGCDDDANPGALSVRRLHMSRTLRVVCSIIVATVAVGAAQTRGRIENGFIVREGVIFDSQHRLFWEVDSLAVEFYVRNGSERIVSLDATRLRRVVQVRTDGSTGAVLEWSRSAVVYGSPPRTETLRDGEPVRLEAQEGVAFPLVLRPLDGRFTFGEYRISFDTAGFRNLLTSDGRTWAGDAMDAGWRHMITLVVRPPETVTETAMMHRLDSRAALEQGDESEAIAAQRKAVAAEPANRQHEYDLGVLLVKLERHAEAIPLFESIDAEHPSANLDDQLVRAYLKVGSEARARSLLRRRGYSDAAAEKMLTTIREQQSRAQ